MPQATARPGTRRHGATPWTVLIAMATAHPAAAQGPVALDSTAVHRTWQVLAIDEACRTAAAAGAAIALPAGGPTCATIRQLMASPFTSPPPGALMLDAAYQATVRGAPGALRSLQGTMTLSSSGGRHGIGPGSLGTAFVSGLTDFLLERARDEVVNSFFQDLRKLFGNSTTLATAFPRTARVLEAADQLGYRTLIPTVHGALRGDLEALPQNLALATALFPAGVPIELQAASAAVGPVRAVAAGAHPLRALTALAEPPATVTDANLRDALRVIGRIAAELDAGTALPLVGGVLDDRTFDEALAALLSRSEYRNVLIAFLIEDLRPLQAAVEDVLRSRPIVTDVIARLNNLRRALDPVLDPRSGGDSADRMTTALAAAVQVLRAGEPLLPSAQRPALTQGIEIADALVRALTTRQWGVFVAELLRVVPRGADGRPVTRLVTLAAAVASADDPTDIKDALHAAADPVGSFRARRTKGGSVALNAYLGGAVGREWVRNVQATDGTDGTFTGVALPVGVELALGTGRVFPSSVGLFLSVLDLGTLASYRLSNTALGADSVEATPEYGIAHVLAPGAYAVLGITRSRPLSVGVGFQYAPRLRQVTNAELAPRDAVRLAVFLALDLTLLRF